MVFLLLPAYGTLCPYPLGKNVFLLRARPFVMFVGALRCRPNCHSLSNLKRIGRMVRLKLAALGGLAAMTKEAEHKEEGMDKLDKDSLGAVSFSFKTTGGAVGLLDRAYSVAFFFNSLSNLYLVLSILPAVHFAIIVRLSF